MSTMNNIVLPTRWVAEVLQYRALAISSLLGEPALSLEASLGIVQVALRCVIEQREAWHNPGMFRYGEMLDKSNVAWVTSNAEIILPEITGHNDAVAVRDVFVSYLLNTLVNEIEKNLLNPHYPDRSFDMLDVMMLDNGDCVLQNKGDYRVWRFEQLVREGKVEY